MSDLLFWRIDFFSEKSKKNLFLNDGIFPQFEGLNFSLTCMGVFKENEKIFISYEEIPKDAIASVIFAEKKDKISKKISFGILSVIYPNGKIIPKGLEYLPKDFVFVKAQNGKHFIFKLKRDKIFSTKEFDENNFKKSSKNRGNKRYPESKSSKKGIFSLSSKAKNYQNWSR